MKREIKVNEVNLIVSATPGNRTVASSCGLGMNFFNTREAREYGRALIEAADVADSINQLKEARSHANG